MLSDKSFEQIPQLTSSRMLDVDTKFDLTPDDFSGTKRAVMIGINYVGQDGELAGCHNDVLNMKEYLMDVHGFEEENITLLMDDGVNTDPTRSNISQAYMQIVQQSQPGDVVYLHYSGKSMTMNAVATLKILSRPKIEQMSIIMIQCDQP
jgi:hypothetical protein